MSLNKQAKTLSKNQTDTLLGYVSRTRNPLRNKVIVLLSVKAGLRAKEIASLTWPMITDSNNEISAHINLTNRASKGNSGRAIPINRELRQALIDLREASWSIGRPMHVITTERSSATSAQMIVNQYARWFSAIGLNGCSSHSGRRTFITNAARKISMVGGSLRDVQVLAGHSNLRTTQRYIEADVAAQRRVVDMI